MTLRVGGEGRGKQGRDRKEQKYVILIGDLTQKGVTERASITSTEVVRKHLYRGASLCTLATLDP
jgi:hypothetical protein